MCLLIASWLWLATASLSIVLVIWKYPPNNPVMGFSGFFSSKSVFRAFQAVNKLGFFPFCLLPIEL